MDTDLTPPAVRLDLDIPSVGIGGTAILLLLFSISLLFTGCVIVLIART